jgi:hypothetical protein
MKKYIVALCLGLGICASAQAQGWLAVTDAEGVTWARIKIVNGSGEDASWVVSNGRTAVASTSGAAETDAGADWDGVVAAGSTEYVWVYGLPGGDINVTTSGGTASGYHAHATPESSGDGEWVIAVDAAGDVTGAIEPASYDVPSHTGTLPDMTVED